MSTVHHTIEVPISGMDCTDCTLHVQHAIAALPGVETVNVFLASEKAVVRLDPAQVDLAAIRSAVKAAGYTVTTPPDQSTAPDRTPNFTRPIFTLFGIVFFVVLFVVVIGEWLGLFEALTERVPWPIGLAIVLIAGYPVFRNVIRVTLKRQIISHTLMSIGVLAALIVGQWATAAVVVFFMRVGDYAEKFTTERARRAVKDLTALAPQTARVERDGVEVELPIDQVRIGDTVIVRPGDQIPVDGEVIDGRATIDQAAITGESMPIEAGPGTHVFAATYARLGHLRLTVTHVGADSTFGRVIKLVEEAEAHRADVQRIADKFSAYYLPVVAGIALLTLILRRDPLETAAVLVVACSCSFALATPIAMLASIGAAAKRGLLIKGGKYLETLARADVLLIDKTGTLTLGQPQITDLVASAQMTESTVLQLAASAEKYSEHPLAEAVRAAAKQRGLDLLEPLDFKAIPGLGVQARVEGYLITVGNQRLVGQDGTLPHTDRIVGQAAILPHIDQLEAQGKTLLYVAQDDRLIGVLAAADTIRPEVPDALKQLRSLGIQRIELLTGDNERTARTLAEGLGVAYRANLLPQDKIAIVKAYQAQGHTVIMVGDGVNDAPALAQADVAVAMNTGTQPAREAANMVDLDSNPTKLLEIVEIGKQLLMTRGALTTFSIANDISKYFAIIPAAFASTYPQLGVLNIMHL
ncbi:MAG TPA: cation-translocating P-type ATPase, partial [Anaerolineae bacterium]|nr:cation-translocating P-type ATPase [Anaerolineae bacterium]